MMKKGLLAIVAVAPIARSKVAEAAAGTDGVIYRR